MALKDITGLRFNRLVAVKFLEVKNKRARWLFRCDCGNEHIAMAQSVKSGGTKSCGCLAREYKPIKHGGSRTRLYSRWTGIRQRCENPDRISYPNYGGRGIRVCEEWKSFERFRDWAEANGYRRDLEIDRIDVDGDYSPDNCRWVTHATNSRNKRNARAYEYKGKTTLLKDIAKAEGIHPQTLYNRVVVRGEALASALRPAVNTSWNDGHCKRGHSMDADNIGADSRGRRFCKKCAKLRTDKYLEKAAERCASQ